jgi:hypothetical protein
MVIELNILDKRPKLHKLGKLLYGKSNIGPTSSVSQSLEHLVIISLALQVYQ